MSELKQITVKLRTPVRDEAGKTIRELTFREPTVDDMLTAEAVGGVSDDGKPTLRATAAMLASMAGIELAVMKRISQRDFLRIVEETSPLLEGSDEEQEAPQPELPKVASAA